MREIKYKGVSIETGEWITGFYGYKEIHEKHFIMEARLDTQNVTGYQYFVDHEVYGESVGQYTGLKDKNGTEVYTGDRYRHKYYSPNWKEHLETEGVVEWDDDKLQYNISGYKSAHLEVIGNKYQSKEG